MTLDVTSQLMPVFYGLVALVLVSTVLLVASALGLFRRVRTAVATRCGSLTGRGSLRHTTRAVRSIR
jgi:hypothetical protein